MYYDLEKFLMEEAKHILERDGNIEPIVEYVEDVNLDALDESWLDKRTSYIWKVGVLSIADGNKRDWAYLFVGHQRNPEHYCELIGKLRFAGGENDDPGRCLQRIIKCADSADCLYDV